MGADRQLRGDRTAHGRLCGWPSTRPSFGARCDVGPFLIAIYGVGLVGAGVFSADPSYGYPPGAPLGPAASFSVHGMLHEVAGYMVFGPLTAACFVFARRFATQRWSPRVGRLLVPDRPGHPRLHRRGLQRVVERQRRELRWCLPADGHHRGLGAGSRSWRSAPCATRSRPHPR